MSKLNNVIEWGKSILIIAITAIIVIGLVKIYLDSSWITKPPSGISRVVYLEGAIEPGSLFRLRVLLDSLGPEDSLLLRINSGGGDLLEGIATAQSIYYSRGRITVEIKGIAMSAAALITCAAGHVRIYPGATFMMHAPYYVDEGTIDEAPKKVHIKGDDKSVWVMTHPSFQRCVDKKFVTAKEYKEMRYNNKEYYYTADTINSRINN